MLKEKNISPTAGQWTIFPRGTDDPAALSFAQQRMWFLHHMEGSAEVYNVPMAFLLKGSFHPDALERSINRVIHRHEILRTYLKESNGEVFQVIVPDLELHIRQHDLRSLPLATRRSQADQILVSSGREWFDLSQLPLMRVDLIRLEEQEAILPGESSPHYHRRMVHGDPLPRAELLLC